MQIRSTLLHLQKLFLQGIALLAPLVITLAFLFWLAHSLELFMDGLLRNMLPGTLYFPGAGVLAALLLIFAMGLLANVFLVRWLVGLSESLIDRIPLVKTVFKAVKDMARFLGKEKTESIGRAVSVELNGVWLVGFLMQEQAQLPGDVPATNRVCVYLPMSFQIGGYSIYVEPERVRELDVSTEDALRAVVTGSALTCANDQNNTTTGQRAKKTRM